MNTRFKRLSKFLKQSRIDSGLMQGDVATKLNYSSSQFISNWERGLSSPPLESLKRIADLYNIRAEELFEIYLEEYQNQIRQEFRKSRKTSG